MSWLRVISEACKHWSTTCKRSSCSCCVLPCMRTSSIIHTAPYTPARICDILLWKCSGAEVIPSGSLRKQYRPYGVINVVRHADSVDSGICQKPELASSLENTVAPASYCWKWVALSTDAFVQFCKVNTYAHPSILLRDHNHPRTPVSRLVDPINDSQSLHPFQFLLDWFHQGYGHSSWNREGKRSGISSELDGVCTFKLSTCM